MSNVATEAVKSVELRGLYPEIQPYNDGFLRVSDLHTVHYEECGKETGNPVIFLHGGPGSGYTPRDRRYFDPEIYRIILLDQRGAGKSTPAAETKENTTWDLVGDVEKLRKHLGIESWVVFGGSWGSTLALAYSMTHPKQVKALIVRGIYLGAKAEDDWLYKTNGFANIYPEAFEEFIHPIPEEERDNLLKAYHKRLMGENKIEGMKLAKIWNRYELMSTKLMPDLDVLAAADEDDLWTLQHARIECHYFYNTCFLEEGWMLDNAHKLENIPVSIVQGRYDMTCPLKSAWDFHKKLPHSQLFIVPAAGHSTKEPGVLHQLLEATDRYKYL